MRRVNLVGEDWSCGLWWDESPASCEGRAIRARCGGQTVCTLTQRWAGGLTGVVWLEGRLFSRRRCVHPLSTVA